MNKPQDLFLDRNKSIERLGSELKEFIEKFVNSDEIIKIIDFINKKTEISTNALKCDSRSFVFKQFIQAQGKFKKTFSMKGIFFESFKFLIYFIFIRTFSKKKSFEKNYEICVDDIQSHNFGTKPERFDQLRKLTNVVFLSQRELKEGYNTFLFKNYLSSIIGSSTCNNFLFYFQCFGRILVGSIKSGVNLFPLFTRILLIYIRYETAFNHIKAKFLIQERPYNTSQIRNEIFHKYGGKICSVIQRNIYQINGVGMYINADILFTFGSSREIIELVNKTLGGNVKRFIPVGSLFTERELYNRKEKNDFPEYDLLVFNSDHHEDASSPNNNYFKDYYEHFNWIRKFAKEFPKFKIAVKNKKQFYDKKARSIIEKLSNVALLIDKKFEWSDSYFLGSKAKALCTWNSTLGIEFIGEGKECYFLDPGLRNTSWLPNDRYFLKVKVKSYEEFREKILLKLKGHKDNGVLENQKEYCYPGSNVSKNILNELRKLENIKLL